MTDLPDDTRSPLPAAGCAPIHERLRRQDHDDDGNLHEAHDHRDCRSHRVIVPLIGRLIGGDRDDRVATAGAPSRWART
jgi:hypothetical protein